LAITDTEERIKQVEETISRIDTPDRQLGTKIFSLKFTRAEELSSLLKANLTNVGSIKVDPSTNSLLITDVRYNLSKLAEIISRLDVFKPATQIFSLRFALAEKMAKLVEDYLGPEEKVEVNKEKNELIVTATVHNLDRIESFIRSRDILERQMSEQHFLIKYVKMDEVLPLVEDALSSGGRLKVDPSRSILSVNDASYNLYKIERIIKAADVFKPEEKVYTLRYAPLLLVAKKAREYLSDKGELEIEEKTGTFIVKDVKRNIEKIDELADKGELEVEEKTGTFIVKDVKRNIEKIDELVKKMDVLEDQLTTKRYFLKYLTPSEAAFFLEDVITEYGKIRLPEVKENLKNEEKDYIVIPQEKVSSSKSSSSQGGESDVMSRNVIYVTDLKRNIPEIDRAIEEMNSASRANEITTKTFYVKEGSLEQIAVAIANIIGVKPEEIQGLKVGKEEVKWMKMEVGTPSIDLGNIGAVGKK